MAYCEAVNDEFKSEQTLIHSVASRLINGQWIKFNDAQAFTSQLDAECYLCMAVYKSQQHSLNDNLRVNIQNMMTWRCAVRQHQLSKNVQAQSGATTTTSRPPESKLLLNKHVSIVNLFSFITSSFDSPEAYFIYLCLLTYIYMYSNTQNTD